MNDKISISEAFSFGWNTFKSNWKFWLIAYLITYVLTTPGIELKKDKKNVKSTEVNAVSSPRFIPDTTNLDQNYNQTDPVVNNLVEFTERMPSETTTAPEDGLIDFTERAPKENTKNILTNIFANPTLVVVLAPYLLITVVGLILVSLAIIALSIVINMGYMHLTLDATRGVPLQFQTLLSDVNLRKATNVLVANLFYALMVGIGLIFLILPGIYIAIKYAFTSYIIVDKNVGISEAFSLSGKLTKGNKFKLFMFMSAAVLIITLGLIAFIVGVIPAAITLSLATAYIYEKLSTKFTNTTVSNVTQQVAG